MDESQTLGVEVENMTDYKDYTCQLGLEDFLDEEQKQLLRDLQEVLQGQASPEGHYEADDICRAFTMSVKEGLGWGTLEVVDHPMVTMVKEHLKRPQDIRVSMADDQHDESAECVDQNMPEANDETNIIQFNSKNRDE